MARGLFITLEGGEGGGKTTQAKRLADWLTDKGHTVVTSREPGGTPGAMDLRHLLLTGDPDRWLPISELLMYSAARYDHVERLLRPALEEGKIVVCDRFFDTTATYQGDARGLPKEDISFLRNLVAKGMTPDLTLILDLPAELAIERSGGKHLGEDRFERTPMDFHFKAHAAFRQLAVDEPERCVIIDATQPLDDVTQAIFKAVEDRLKL